MSTLHGSKMMDELVECEKLVIEFDHTFLRMEHVELRQDIQFLIQKMKHLMKGKDNN